MENEINFQSLEELLKSPDKYNQNNLNEILKKLFDLDTDLRGKDLRAKIETTNIKEQLFNIDSFINRFLSITLENGYYFCRDCNLIYNEDSLISEETWKLRITDYRDRDSDTDYGWVLEGGELNVYKVYYCDKKHRIHTKLTNSYKIPRENMLEIGRYLKKYDK